MKLDEIKTKLVGHIWKVLARLISEQATKAAWTNWSRYTPMGDELQIVLLRNTARTQRDYRDDVSELMKQLEHEIGLELLPVEVKRVPDTNPDRMVWIITPAKAG